MSSSKRRVLLVGWDAADWKIIHPLMDQGKMPTVKRLVETGVMANLATLHPVLSPMLWTSIATGKRPWKHGIHGFSEPTPDGQGIRPITNLSRKTKAIWNILSQNNLTSNVVGWWPSQPAEPIRGVMVSNHFHPAAGPPEQPWPVPPRSVHPPELAEQLAPLRLNPNELGAEHILPFIPGAAKIDQDKDPRLGMCAKILAECTSVHATATWLMENEPWDFMAVYYDAIDHFCHGFMRYHPPQLKGVPDGDFALYSGVIEAAYRYHDMMLHRLLQLAGPETTVILMSDHGFHPDHLRPKTLPAEPAGPATEHRDLGIFVLNGPAVKKDELIHGLNLLDITPTILSLFGLPVGEDMDGKPALDAFADPLEASTIPSWDEVAGDTGEHAADLQLDPVESQEAIAQLVALGYIEPVGNNRQQAITETVRELDYNLARSFMDGNHHEQAAEILEKLYEQWPNEHRFGVQLAMCYRGQGRISDLRGVVEDLSTRRKADALQAREDLTKFVEQHRDVFKRKGSVHEATDTETDLPDKTENRKRLSPDQQQRFRNLTARTHYNPYAIDYLWAYVHMAEENFEEALACLSRSEQIDAERPGLHIQIGEAYLNLKRAKDAERSFRTAATIDPDNPHAHLGIARSYLLQRRNKDALQAALASVGLLFENPLAHYYLAVALHRTRRWREAIDALEVALSINPHFAEAHQKLAQIYRSRLNDRTKADEHLKQAQEMSKLRKKKNTAARVYQTQARIIPVSRVEDVNPNFKETRTADKPSDGHDTSLEVDSNQPIVVVSGLPRSGTSMVMQMLAAGGMPVLVDEHRAPDESNPKGYFEYEPVKKLRIDDSWLPQACGKAVKIIAQLLPSLPKQYRYQVLFIERDMNEVIASQEAMLQRNNQAGAQLTQEQLSQVFLTQVSRVRNWLGKQTNMELLSIDHGEVIENAMLSTKRINDFLSVNLDVGSMVSAVDRKFYRHRSNKLQL